MFWYCTVGNIKTFPESIRKANIHLSNNIHVMFPAFMVVIYCVGFLPNCWLLSANDYNNKNPAQSNVSFRNNLEEISNYSSDKLRNGLTHSVHTIYI